jgi:flagellar FliL protein
MTLAKEIRRESLKPLGVVVEDEEPEEADSAADHDGKKPKKKKKKHAPVVYPVTAVHFSNIIVQ